MTPISAVGVNFGFVEEDSPSELARLFQIADVKKLSDGGFQITQTEILRTIPHEDRLLNLRLAQDENGSVHLKANYHSDVLSATQASETIETKVVQLNTACVELISRIYGLSLDPEEQYEAA